MFKSDVSFSGKLKTRIIRAKRAPLSWQLRNFLRWQFFRNWVTWHLARSFSKITGIATLTGRIKAVLVKANGETVNYGWLAYGLVTVAFVNFMVDELQADTTEWGDFKYHDSGVGVTGAANTDTDIETTDGESRVAGTQVEGASAYIYRSVGTIPYTTTKAITEHGLFSQSTGTTMMDHHVFSAINVDNGDSIQFTYELTCNAET